MATTRPETMFADVAIAVHPDDDRYSQFVGKLVSFFISVTCYRGVVSTRFTTRSSNRYLKLFK